MVLASIFTQNSTCNRLYLRYSRWNYNTTPHQNWCLFYTILITVNPFFTLSIHTPHKLSKHRQPPSVGSHVPVILILIYAISSTLLSSYSPSSSKSSITVFILFNHTSASSVPTSSPTFVKCVLISIANSIFLSNKGLEEWRWGMTEQKYTVSANVLLDRVALDGNWSSGAGTRLLCKYNKIGRRRGPKCKSVTYQKSLETSLITSLNVNQKDSRFKPWICKNKLRVNIALYCEWETIFWKTLSDDFFLFRRCSYLHESSAMLILWVRIVFQKISQISFPLSPTPSCTKANVMTSRNIWQMFTKIIVWAIFLY